MKILKYLFFLLLIFIIGASIYIATKDGKFQVEEQQLIMGPQEVVFNEVNDLTTWKYWEPWSQETDDMIVEYGAKTKGEGASYSWNSEEMGNGSVTITKSNPFSSIEQQLAFDRPFGESISQIYWEFEQQGDSTLVTWGMKGDQTFMEKVAFTFQDQSIDEMMKPMMQKGLNNLQEIIRKKIDSHSITVEGITQHGGGYYMYAATGSRLSQVPEKVANITRQVSEYMNSNNIEKSGNPFVLFNQLNYQQKTGIYSAGYFTPSEVVTPAESDILSGYLPKQRTLKTTLKGDYKYLQAAWDSAYAYIEKNNIQLQQDEQPFEFFVIGPKDHANPAEWVTQVFIPLASENDQILGDD